MGNEKAGERMLYLVILEYAADEATATSVKNAIGAMKGVKSVTEVKAEV